MRDIDLQKMERALKARNTFEDQDRLERAVIIWEKLDKQLEDETIKEYEKFIHQRAIERATELLRQEMMKEIKNGN
jgi:hypothetical protein